MTYVWEKNDTFTQHFISGDVVNLNPAWTAYAYLKQEFGKMFPARVDSVSRGGDVVYIRVGGKPLPFGAQVLTKRGQA